ncbi:hypothetical protein RJT34_33489 [Clitoria ternatea]|uniref:RRM domain-containing protein n=1 Tax=Clitoria ternatea TaxID=43366 RepID=A0AAN9F022_CLITE
MMGMLTCCHTLMGWALKTWAQACISLEPKNRIKSLSAVSTVLEIDTGSKVNSVIGKALLRLGSLRFDFVTVMAFFARLGNVLRHAANRQVSSELRSPPLSVFQAIRCMSNGPSSKLFIGGVSYNTDEQSLREAFSKYGDVVDARIIMDRETGRSRGFGFITYSSVEEASSAIQALDGQDLHGRRIRVNYASDRPRGFGGGFGGSYGNAPYGAAGAGYGGGGGYGGNPAGGYGGGGYGGNPAGGYGGGGYGGNAAGGYGGGGYNAGGYGSGGNYGDSGAANNYPASDSYGTSSAGGSYSGSGMNYGNDGNFTSGNTHTGGNIGGYTDNTGNFGDAGVGNHGSSAGFTGSGYDGSAVDGSGGTGSGTGFTGGYDGSGGLEFGSSGQLDSKESGDKEFGGFGESSEGNYKDDDGDADNFAKRA